MKQSTVRRIASTCTITVVVLAGVLVGSPANASTEADVHTHLTQEQVAALGAGVDLTHRVFDGQAARDAGAPTDAVSQFAAGYQAGGGMVENTTVDRSESGRLDDISITACKGKNSFDVTGAQANLYINSCKTNEVVKGIQGGVAVATLIGSILAVTGGGAAAAGVAAAGFALGAVLIGNKNKGKGVKFWANPLTAGVSSQ